MSKNIKNKIGYVDNKYLGINKPKGHYVYIRKVNNDGTCDVNVVTSLEDRNAKLDFKKIKQVIVFALYRVVYFYCRTRRIVLQFILKCYHR